MAAAAPSARLAAAHPAWTGHRRSVHRPATALGTRARTHLVGRDRVRALHRQPAHPDRHHPVVGVRRVQARHRDARGAGRPCDDRGRTARSDPGRLLRDSDLHSRAESVWLVRAGLIRQQPAGPHLPEGPPSAPARPPATRHTGRAALPSATLPHVLPAVRQILGPLQLSAASGSTTTGAARHSRLFVRYQFGSPATVLDHHGPGLRTRLLERPRRDSPGDCQTLLIASHASPQTRCMRTSLTEPLFKDQTGGPDQIRTGGLLLDREAC
jgi:hypothetical protein